jgi:hypothetical protein
MVCLVLSIGNEGGGGVWREERSWREVGFGAAGF